MARHCARDARHEQAAAIMEKYFEFSGSATRIRTWNLPVNSRPLYR